jgi:hypothetical protein
MTEDERIEIIEGALAKEYSGIWHWEPTPIDNPYGPDDRDKIAKFAERIQGMRKACIEALLELPDEELTMIRDFKREPMEISTWPWSELLPERLHPARLASRQPGRLAYGFGHPHFRADFDYWAKLPNLTLMEATLLSVGTNPNFLDQDEIYKLKKEKPEKLWASLRFLLERYDLLFRVFPSALMGKGPMSTARFYDWVKEVDLDIHPDFRMALSRRFDGTVRSTSTADATPSEKVSLLKMIAAMAVEQYGYDPSAQKNDAVKALCDDLDGLGIGLDPKTIRKWLKEACALIDPENLRK